MNDETTTVETTAPASKTTLSYADGVEKVFGPKGKIFTESKIENEILTTTVYLNQIDDDGVGISKVFTLDTNSPENREFSLKLAARGAEDYIKASVGAISTFHDVIDSEGNVDEKGILSTIDQKIGELSSLTIVTRVTGQGSAAILSKLELAYAKLNEIDVESPEGYSQVKTWYDAIPKENRVVPDESSELYIPYLIVSKEIDDKRKEMKDKLFAEKIAKAQAKKN